MALLLSDACLLKKQNKTFQMNQLISVDLKRPAAVSLKYVIHIQHEKKFENTYTEIWKGWNWKIYLNVLLIIIC